MIKKTLTSSSLTGRSAPTSDTLDSFLSSGSSAMGRKTSLSGRSDTKRKLKANIILIEHEQEEDGDDYVIINRSGNENKLALARSFTNQNLSMDYDSGKLQSEIENLKKMRQNYGTDWLLSTPNLVLNDIRQGFGIGKEKMMLDDLETCIAKTESLDIEDNLRVIESFPVYCIGEEGEETCLCILSIDEKHLIERDEANKKLLSLNEISNLADIIDLSKTKFVEDLKQIDSKKFRIFLFFKI